MRENTLINLKQVTEDKKVPYSEQSANVLFKFMKKIDYLKEILINKAIIPRYYEEILDYLKIDNLERITFPMVCFCDINMSKLSKHVSYYGKFGIGLTKKWGIEKGIQCIHYINTNSPIRKDFTHIFSKALSEETDNNITEEYNNYLLSNLLFMKPISGLMPRNNSYDNKNFTDEKEWRYVPKITPEDKIQLIVPSIYAGNTDVYNTYSDALKDLPHLWLEFNFKDIEYIMVSTKKHRQELINFILNNNFQATDYEKYELISKIIVYNVIRKDW